MSWTAPAFGSASWVEIPVVNIARAKEFYGSTLGWTFHDNKRASDPRYHNPDNYLIYNTGNGSFSGGLKRVDASAIPPLSSTQNGAGTTRLYFFVENIEEVLNKVKKHGGEVIRGVQSESVQSVDAYFKDTEGNVQGLYQLK